MKGHIAKKGSRYYVVLDDGRDPRTGKRKQRWHAGFQTKKEAERALPELLSSLQNGTYVAPSRVTLAQFLTDEWLPAIQPNVRPGTFSLYETCIRAYVIPHLGSKQLQDVTPSDISKAYGRLISNGRRGGKSGLAPKTVRNVHTTLRKALDDALRWGRVQRNVAALVSPPKLSGKEMTFWSAGDLRTFLRSVSRDRLYAAWLVLATTGMRRGELLGLKWDDIDLDVGRATVRRALVLVDHVPTWSEPKTLKGKRPVALPRETVAALRQHRKSQLAERFAIGASYGDKGLVFADPLGDPIHPNTFQRSFKRLVTQAGVKPIRLHDIRHTFATLALRAGVHPKVVSEMLGHSNISITLDTYSHAIPSMETDAAEKVAALFLA